MGLQIRNRNKYKKEVEKRYGENNEILDAGSALMRGVNWKKSKKKRGKEHYGWFGSLLAERK